MRNLFMMNIQKSKKRRFLINHTQKPMIVLLCLMNIMKVFLKTMSGKKVWLNRKSIGNIIKEISLSMIAIKKMF
jgi:hypothetical protein